MIAATRVRSACTTAGLKAALTSRRRRVCTGASLRSIQRSQVRSSVESAMKGRSCA
ncbi:MAG: hypothetical protein M3Z95_00795 [Actinomycetota bacterium]|nr:hypothetical protein [Actinomycetota bacterium]